MARHALVDRPSKRSELIEWYRQAVIEFEASGLSLPEFAERIGVSAATMYAWRKRLESARPEQRAYGLVEVEVKPATTPEPARSQSPADFTVRISSTFSIAVPVGFDADELRRLVRVIESC